MDNRLPARVDAVPSRRLRVTEREGTGCGEGIVLLVPKTMTRVERRRVRGW